MSDALSGLLQDSLTVALPPAVSTLAERLARDAGARIALFYGSNLRTGSLDGVLDFYLLTDGARERGIWPTVGYREIEIEGRVLRVKIATMRLATFRAAAEARTLDTTIWTRFAQPAALAWSADSAADDAVAVVGAAAVSAARFAAALGPERGRAEDYWHALFRATYAAELRIEPRGREDDILRHHGEHLARLLPAAWQAGGVPFAAEGAALAPAMAREERARLRQAWALRRRLGKPINAARLVRAAFTFDGAARYAAWKIERHTGVAIPVTPWRERHPVLAAPGVLWQLWRRRR